MAMSQSESPLARKVILCDESGHPTGIADLMTAHTGAGQLHVAFSVYIFSLDRSKILVQQRAAGKMLWPLVWANTCCSHPRLGETPVEAGRRRLMEEMGFACELTAGPAFVYHAADPAGRGVEHEYDVLLVGTTGATPNPDPSEVAAWEWMEMDTLRQDMRRRPDRYAPWFHQGMPLIAPE
jgi:isopentenyl-diphosphate Delta-isomerase